MPTPKGGHEGRLMLAPGAGEALVTITGLQDANYDPGQAFAAAHGMDATHGFNVPVKSTPKVTANRVDDKAQTTVWKCVRLTEAGTPCPFVFYPIGESSDADALAHGISGTAWVMYSSANSLSDAIKGPIEVSPAAGDWAPFGNWDPV